MYLSCCGVGSNNCALRPRESRLRGRCWQCRAKALLQAARKLRRRKAVVLRAADLDLQGSHEGCDATGHLPVKTVHETMNDTRAIGIAAAGRIDNGARRGAWNRELVSLRITVSYTHLR